MRFGLILYLIFHCCLPSGIAQSNNLYSVWENENNSDSLRLDAFKNYIWFNYMFTDPDSALILSETFYEFAKKTDQQNFVGAALNHQAVALSIKGESEESLERFHQALDIYLKNGNEQIATGTYSNIGTILHNKGNYKEAAEYFFKSLALAEKYNNKQSMSAVLNNIGVLYFDQKLFDLSYKYHLKTLQLKLELNNDIDIGMSYYNIGSFHVETKKIDSAIYYFEKSLAYFTKSNHAVGLGNYYLSMGHIYYEKKMFLKSLELYERADKYFTEIDDIRNITITETHIGMTYQQLGEIDLALMYLIDAYERSKKLKIITTTKIAAQGLYLTFKDRRDYNNALNYYEIYNNINDSLVSIEKTEATVHLKFEHEYDKKSLIDSLDYVNGQELNLAEIREQKAALAKAKTQRYALFGGIALMLIFGLFIYRSYRRKKRDHDIITNQHHQLSESHKEIKQSIEYAKRLQDAILPTQHTLSLHFKNYFVLFKPKDVVSGDFYWFEYDSKMDTRIFAVADCTGHGVPGAMVSLVCATALNSRSLIIHLGE